MSTLNTQFKQWTAKHVQATLPLRQTSSHKGSYGTALLVAGSKNMPGAALLAGLGAMRSGLGKLVIATDADIALIVTCLPEATYMQNGLQQLVQQKEALGSYDAIAIGPGMIFDDNTKSALRFLFQSHVPLILDAGALQKMLFPSRDHPTILTPHAAEFSRITKVDIQKLQQNRVHYATVWAKKLAVTLVLKGPSTVIAFPDGETWINPTGNSTLAKGGSGDTLTGMILGMLCCHENWKHAVLNAVYLHGACADEWLTTRSAHTLLAHELMDVLPIVWKRFEN